MQMSDAAPGLVSEMLASKLDEFGMRGDAFQRLLGTQDDAFQKMVETRLKTIEQELCHMSQLRDDARTQQGNGTASTCNTSADRDVMRQFCADVRKDHTPAHKQQVKDKIQSSMSNISEQQMLQWIQEFNYSIYEEDAESSAFSPASADIAAIGAELLQPSNATQQMTNTLQDIFVVECCLLSGVRNEDSFIDTCKQHLIQAHRTYAQLPAGEQDKWWRDQRSRLQNSYSICVGFLPGAFSSTSSARNPRRRRRSKGTKSADASSTDSPAASFVHFVPEDFHCAESWRVQVDALFNVLVVGSDAQKCKSCAMALRQLFNDVTQWKPWKPPTAEMTERLLQQVTSNMASFASDAVFIDESVYTLAQLCREQSVCLGLIVSDCDLVDLVSERTAAKLASIVDGHIPNPTCEENFQWYAMLLARTQRFSVVCDMMTKHGALDKMHGVLDDVLTGFRRQLVECGSDNVTEAKRASARHILRQVAQQRVTTCFGAFSWVQREFQEVSKQRQRFLLAGLLCPIDEEILKPLRTIEDETLMLAGLQAIQEWWALTSDEGEKHKLLGCSFGMQQKVNNKFEEVECTRMNFWAVAMQGVATSPNCVGYTRMGTAIDKVLETTNDYKGDKVFVLHIAMWALEEFFSGASDFGFWDRQVYEQAFRVLQKMQDILDTWETEKRSENLNYTKKQVEEAKETTLSVLNKCRNRQRPWSSYRY